MRITTILASACLALGCLAPMTVQAEDCGPLKFVAAVDMELTPGGQVLLPVTVNGTPRRFLFDTGGTVSQISSAVADELKLRRRDSPIKLFDVSGNISDKLAVVDSFAIGPLKGADLLLQISSTFMGRIAGVITPSLFPHLDIDIDFGPRRLAFFATDHCIGHVTYWKTSALAVVPMTMRNLHINVPVTVEGHTLQAIIDTGATGTFMEMDVAKRVFGLTPDSPGMTLAGYANGDHNLPLYGHIFSSLSFGGVSVVHAHVEIMPDRMASKDRDNDVQTGSLVKHVDDNIERPELTVGMNVLKQLHVYIAQEEHNLYISAAGRPDEPSPFGPPAAPPATSAR
jgi:predicted aspartyl protease